jgi:hypothetical protein
MASDKQLAANPANAKNQPASSPPASPAKTLRTKALPHPAPGESSPDGWVFSTGWFITHQGRVKRMRFPVGGVLMIFTAIYIQQMLAGNGRQYNH